MAGRCSRRSARLLAGALAVVASLPASLAFADTVHTIQSGETLSGIADNYGVTQSAIEDYNGISNPDFIIEGSKIVIPGVGDIAQVYEADGSGGSGTYRVQLGDTLSHVAQMHGLTLFGIMELNGLTDPDYIYEGQHLSVPATVAAAAAAGAVSRDEVRGYLLDAAVEFGIAPDLLMALAWQESGWQHGAVSHAGAIGIMQVIPSTAAWATESLVSGAEDWRVNPRSNVRVGAAVLSQLIDQAGGDGDLALAFYVQGWYSIEQFGWFDETYQYVANVTALRDFYR